MGTPREKEAGKGKVRVNCTQIEGKRRKTQRS